jgi:hypothetical protein
MREGQTNQRLGYPADARLLIVNADDFGMCHAVNQAVVAALEAGIARSTSLMVPGPSLRHAIRFLRAHPEISFGVHLTAISDSAHNRWRPLTAGDRVPSLVDEAGDFYDFERMPEFLDRVRLDELELEFRAQIEAVLAAGLAPVHLDWHALRIRDRPHIFEVMLGLAREYGLALRAANRSSIEGLQRQGFVGPDHDVLDSYLLDSVDKAARYAALLRGLPAGLSEWAVHPGLDSPELRAIEPGGAHIRQADFEFLVSRKAKEIIEEEGIILLDKRALQAAWQEGRNHR